MKITCRREAVHRLFPLSIAPTQDRSCARIAMPASRHPPILNVHRRRHAGDKPFACDICGKRFVIKANLRQLRRTHTGKTPFSCGVCSKTFADRHSHIRVHLTRILVPSTRVTNRSNAPSVRIHSRDLQQCACTSARTRREALRAPTLREALHSAWWSQIA